MVAAQVRMAVAGGETAEPMRNHGKKGARDGRAGALELGGNRRLATGERRTEEARGEAGVFFGRRSREGGGEIFVPKPMK